MEPCRVLPSTPAPKWDPAQRLALRLRAVYNYSFFLGEAPSGAGSWCTTRSSVATLHVRELSHVLSSAIRCLLRPRSV